MGASGNLERLLPSLFEFLSSHPFDAHARWLAAPTDGVYTNSSRGSGNTSATGHLPAPLSVPTESSCTPPAPIADSYARWRRCITVWRTVIGNDSVFLAVLLHAGCLWCPDYAALHQARHRIAMRARHKQSSASSGPLPKAGSEAVEGRRDSKELAHHATSTANGLPNTLVKRRGKRRGRAVAEAAADAVRALAAAADAHAELAAACPASVWALHVLHFLRVEEVCALPFSRYTRSLKVQRDGKTSNLMSGSSLGVSSDCSEGDVSAASSSTCPSRSSSRYSDSTLESNCGDSDQVKGAVEKPVLKKRRTATDQPARGKWGRGARGVTGQRQSGRGGRGGASKTNDRREGDYLHVEGRPWGVGAPPDLCESQLATSSSLLPKLTSKESNGGGGGSKRLGSTLAAVLAVLQEQEERHNISVSRRDRSEDDGAAVKAEGGPCHVEMADERGCRSTCYGGCGVCNQVCVTAEQKHMLLLRATITLVSEEEPLVQQVATALVNEWLDLLSVDISLSRPCETTTDASSMVKGEEISSTGVGSTSGACSSSRSRSAPTRKPASCTETPMRVHQHRRMCHARHYWLSSLLKMVGYLDGAHSALREENVHISAVLARQGIVPQDAEDIFTKSLPAIFNCALVEEVLQSGETATSQFSQPRSLTARSASSLSTSTGAAPTLRLWMPPFVMLLPFHLIGRGSTFHIFVPPSTASDSAPIDYTRASTAARSSTRAQGRFVSCVVDSYGLYLGLEPQCNCQTRDPSHLVTKVEGSDRSATPYASTRRSSNVSGQRAVAGALDPWWSMGHPQLGFEVRCGNFDSLLEPCYVASVQHLLPSLRVPDTPNKPTTASDVHRGHLEQSPSVRWWSCMMHETAGSPCMDVRVARTLFMLPIPAQGTGDTVTDHPISVPGDSSDGVIRRLPGDELSPARSRAEHKLGVLGSTSLAPLSNKRPRRGLRRRSVVSAEEQAVRRQHPQLHHAMRLHLRAEQIALKADSHCSENDAAELVLLYGSPRGEEATALRHMGFTVRTSCNSKAGRSSSSRGSIGALYTRGMGPSTVSSVTGSNDGGGGGRPTLARDALGTTLEGMYLVARRVLGLQGIFVPSLPIATPSPTAATHNDSRERPPFTCPTTAGDEGSCPSGTATTTTNGKISARSSHMEKEALGTVAATLVLTCLVLSHSLVKDLLQKPILVLWTTELASFIVDVSLLMPRPIPRLLRADGFAFALLLQPAQSLLLMVGLAATLVTREVCIEGAQNGGGGRKRDTDGASTESLYTVPQWYPWWSAFRTAVLRDAELPSCLYSGIWPIVEKAEDTLFIFAAEARWGTSDSRQATNCKRSHSSSTAECGGTKEDGSAVVTSASLQGRGRPRGGGGGRVLSLSGPLPVAASGPYSAVDAQGVSSGHSDAHSSGRKGGSGTLRGRRLFLSVPSQVGAGGQPLLSASPRHSSSGGPVGITASRSQADPLFRAPRILCGPAVLCQGEEACGMGSETAATPAVPGAALLVEKIAVMSGRDMALLSANPAYTDTASPLPGMLSLSATKAVQLPRLTSAFASALWVSLEAQEMYWPTGAA